MYTIVTTFANGDVTIYSTDDQKRYASALLSAQSIKGATVETSVQG